MTRARIGLYGMAMAASLLLVGACAEPPSSPLDGKPAPQVAVQPLQPGGDIRLSDYKGKVVLLDFWATWCGPCRGIMPQLGEFQEKYRDQGLVILGITDENRTTVQQFFAAVGPSKYTIAIDPTQRAGAAYGVSAMPTTVLIGRDGKVRHVETGVDTSVGIAPLEERIKAALAEKI